MTAKGSDLDGLPRIIQTLKNGGVASWAVWVVRNLEYIHKTLVKVAIPLEVLVASDKDEPIDALSPELRVALYEAVDLLRTIIPRVEKKDVQGEDA